MIGSGAALGFNFFRKNDFLLYFLLLELFSVTLISWAFMIASLIKKASQAISLGFAMFFLGYFLQVAANIVFREGEKPVRIVFSLLSPTILQVQQSFYKLIFRLV